MRRGYSAIDRRSPSGPDAPGPSGARPVLAELAGTAGLVLAVVGSGISASRLSPDPGVQLLVNAVATGAALAVLVAVLGPVSGAHLNPAVTLVARAGRAVGTRTAAAYAAAQVVGAALGAVLANVMFALPAATFSSQRRGGGGPLVAEVLATFGLVVVVFALPRLGRAGAVPAALGAYVAAACLFTSSTAFANPALTAGRTLTDTFAGIAPASLPGFAAAQVVGALAAAALLVRPATAAHGGPASRPPAPRPGPPEPVPAPGGRS